jgi:hypothetical protein
MAWSGFQCHSFGNKVKEWVLLSCQGHYLMLAPINLAPYWWTPLEGTADGVCSTVLTLMVCKLKRESPYWLHRTPACLLNPVSIPVMYFFFPYYAKNPDTATVVLSIISLVILIIIFNVSCVCLLISQWYCPPYVVYVCTISLSLFL